MSLETTTPAILGTTPDVVDGVQVGRLLKLADHLETGKRGHKTFDFSVLFRQARCGTAGCAIGECPWVFPDEWHLARVDWGGVKYDPELRENSNGDGWEDAIQFFGISERVADSLFMPGECPRFNGVRLGDDATPVAVAANIRAYVDTLAPRAQSAPQTEPVAATQCTEDAAAPQEPQPGTVSKEERSAVVKAK